MCGVGKLRSDVHHRATLAHNFARQRKLYDTYLYTYAWVLSLSASVCGVLELGSPVPNRENRIGRGRSLPTA